MKNAMTQKPTLKESYKEEVKKAKSTSIADVQLDMLVHILKIIQDEGVLNKLLFNEKDLISIKEEIIELLRTNSESGKMKSIWMNYSGSSGAGGPTKASVSLNIGKKDPVLQYTNTQHVDPNITSLMSDDSGRATRNKPKKFRNQRR